MSYPCNKCPYICPQECDQMKVIEELRDQLKLTEDLVRCDGQKLLNLVQERDKLRKDLCCRINGLANKLEEAKLVSKCSAIQCQDFKAQSQIEAEEDVNHNEPQEQQPASQAVQEEQPQVPQGQAQQLQEDFCCESDVRNWLCAVVNLPQYLEFFIAEGFDNMDSVETLTEVDLAEMGIVKKGHRYKIMRFVRRLQENRC